MQLEFTTFAKLAKASADTDEVGTRDGETETHRGFRYIENSVFVQSEAIWFVCPVDEMNEVFPLHTRRSANGVVGNIYAKKSTTKDVQYSWRAW